MLFLLCVNVNHAIISQIRLFADDSVLYITICNQNDHLFFQNDIDKIFSWAGKLLIGPNINNHRT